MDRITRSQLRTEARLYADERTSGFLEDTGGSLDAITDAKIRKVRSWVCGRMGGSGWFEERDSWTTAAGTANYCLDTTGTETAITTYPPTSIRELTLHWSSTEKERVEVVSEPEFEALKRLTWGQYSPKGATLRGRYLCLAPTPTAAVSATITYLPTYQSLGTGTADILFAPEGFRECVTLETAIQIRGMQDEPTQNLRADLVEAYSTLGKVVAARAPAFGERIIDVHPEFDGSDPDELLPPA